jgi:dTDP-4-amino-4,6-dideoxygalactose transaminase
MDARRGLSPIAYVYVLRKEYFMMNNDKPAILGGSSLFPDGLSIFKPTLPPFEELQDQFAECFETGMLTGGRFLREFEARLAEHLCVDHVICVSSCTIGLMLAYKALEFSGEVVVPSFTFMATVHAAVWNNATPVFVDVDPETWNIDPQRVEEAITPRTTAIVGVHLLGTPANVEALEDIAQRYDVKLVFDAAHGFGALHNGEPLGRYGDAEVFSATPTKVLVAVEGGVVATDDAETARRVRILRNYGNPGNYDSEFAGLNARMPEFNAIVGLDSLARLEDHVVRRNQIVDIYRQRIGALPGTVFQRVEPQDRCSRKELSLLIEPDAFGLTRDELAKALDAEGIDTRFYYDPPVHTHTCYEHLRERSEGQLPVTEAIARKTITIPVYSHMDRDTAARVCRAVERVHRHSDQVREAVGAQ